MGNLDIQYLYIFLSLSFIFLALPTSFSALSLLARPLLSSLLYLSIYSTFSNSFFFLILLSLTQLSHIYLLLFLLPFFFLTSKISVSLSPSLLFLFFSISIWIFSFLLSFLSENETLIFWRNIYLRILHSITMIEKHYQIF